MWRWLKWPEGVFIVAPEKALGRRMRDFANDGDGGGEEGGQEVVDGGDRGVWMAFLASLIFP